MPARDETSVAPDDGSMLTIRGGYVQVPEGPGLGVQVDEEGVAFVQLRGGRVRTAAQTQDEWNGNMQRETIEHGVVPVRVSTQGAQCSNFGAVRQRSATAS